MICSTTWSGSPSSASRRSAPKREKRLRLRQEQLEPLGAREQKGGRCPLSLPRIFERATACKAPRPRLTPSEVGMAAEPSRWGSSCPGPKSRNSLQVGSWGSSGPEGWNSSPPVGELALPGSADWRCFRSPGNLCRDGRFRPSHDRNAPSRSGGHGDGPGSSVALPRCCHR
jgi:hypothetical protein